MNYCTVNYEYIGIHIIIIPFSFFQYISTQALMLIWHVLSAENAFDYALHMASEIFIDTNKCYNVLVMFKITLLIYQFVFLKEVGILFGDTVQFCTIHFKFFCFSNNCHPFNTHTQQQYSHSTPYKNKLKLKERMTDDTVLGWCRQTGMWEYQQAGMMGTKLPWQSSWRQMHTAWGITDRGRQLPTRNFALGNAQCKEWGTR